MKYTASASIISPRVHRHVQESAGLGNARRSRFGDSLCQRRVVLSRDSRSSEKFIHGIKVLMAKNYFDNLSEETRKGMIEKAEQGIWPSFAPLAYRNVVGPNGKRTMCRRRPSTRSSGIGSTPAISTGMARPIAVCTCQSSRKSCGGECRPSKEVAPLEVAPLRSHVSNIVPSSGS